MLPAQLQDSIDMSNVPVIGASPDGLTSTDPGSSIDIVSLLGCKTKAPFRQTNNSKWHRLREPAPDAKVTAEHYCQVQMQLLVTGKCSAYLVSWSCAEANIFRIDVNYEWVTAALQLLCTVQRQYLIQGQVQEEKLLQGQGSNAVTGVTKIDTSYSQCCATHHNCWCPEHGCH